MKLKNITDLCDIQIGRTPKRSEMKYWNKGYTWVSIADMKTKYIDKSKEEITGIAVEECNMKLIPKNTVIMSFKLSIGKVAITKKDLYTNEAIAGFIIKDASQLLPEYLYHILQMYNFDSLIDRAAKGATLNKGKLSQMEIPFVEIDKQEKIIEILNKAQGIIDTRKRQLATLSSLKQSIFLDMFGDPLSNEMNHPMKPFDYFATIDTKMVRDFSGIEEFPHIGIGEIEKESGRILEYRTVGESNLASGKYLFTSNHIIYSKIRPNLNKVALPEFEGVCSADAYPLLVNKENTNKVFFAHLLRSKAFLDYIETVSSRTNIPKVNKKQLRLFSGICPPIDLQNEFSSIVNKIDDKNSVLIKSLEQLEKLYQSLTQKAFNGELFND